MKSNSSNISTTGVSGKGDGSLESVHYDVERLATLTPFAESAERFVASGTHLKRARALRSSHPGYDRLIWGEMANLGWLGTIIPEEYGGVGLGTPEASVIAQTLARQLLPEPFSSVAVLTGRLILEGDNPVLKSLLLPAMASGKRIVAAAWREEGDHFDPLNPSAVARESRGKVRLSGSKCVVHGGAGADGFIVTARSKIGIGLYWVPVDALAREPFHIEMADGRIAAELVLDGTVVPEEHCIAKGQTAASALLRAYDDALLMGASELYGVLSAALDLTFDYLKTRRQFGKPIGSFQALQHRSVDMYIQKRLCQHALDEARLFFFQEELGADRRGALASRVKARCSAAGLQITLQAIQMHGAMGFSDEADIGLFLKRAITLAAWLGGADVHRQRFENLAQLRSGASI